MRAKTPVFPAPDRPKRWHGSVFLKSSSGALKYPPVSIDIVHLHGPLPPGFTARSTEMMHEINARGK
tara:strand:- start:211 stop:411 length:201 start_codon:yes stop_codon:yes gene_type:complete